MEEKKTETRLKSLERGISILRIWNSVLWFLVLFLLFRYFSILNRLDYLYQSVDNLTEIGRSSGDLFSKVFEIVELLRDYFLIP